MKEELVYLGVDIAKAYLDAAIGNEKRRFSNDGVGHRELINWIKQIAGPVQVICEPSGGYERAFVQADLHPRTSKRLVQANRVRAFARAAGILAKTDRIDAQVLCAFGAAMRPAPTITASNLDQEHLRELRKPTPSLNSLAGDGAESGCASERHLRAEIKPQSNQPDPKADRANRSAGLQIKLKAPLSSRSKHTN